MDSLKWISKGLKNKPQPFYVLVGDEEFLKRQVIAILIPLILEDAEPSFALSTFPGDKTDFSTVRNELDTLPFLSPARLVIVEQGDKFVTEHRSALEKFVGAPSKTGVLVLDVKSWTSSTKLAKLVPDASTIVCEAPKPYVLPKWCIEWAESRYEKTMKLPAAEMLVELVGPTMGLLASELEKLSVFVGERGTIEVKDVDKLVGRSREANIWRVLDAIGDGKTHDAMDVLGELFEQGDEPLKILGYLGSSIRRLANAARLMQQGIGMEDAIDRCGFKWPAAKESGRKQLRHLGPRRTDMLFDWLIEVDLGAKGESPLPPRVLVERLIVRMARPRE